MELNKILHCYNRVYCFFYQGAKLQTNVQKELSLHFMLIMAISYLIFMACCSVYVVLSIVLMVLIGGVQAFRVCAYSSDWSCLSFKVCVNGPDWSCLICLLRLKLCEISQRDKGKKIYSLEVKPCNCNEYNDNAKLKLVYSSLIFSTEPEARMFSLCTLDSRLFDSVSTILVQTSYTFLISGLILELI